MMDARRAGNNVDLASEPYCMYSTTHFGFFFYVRGAMRPVCFSWRTIVQMLPSEGSWMGTYNV